MARKRFWDERSKQVKKKEVSFLLEESSPQSIQSAKDQTERLITYNWYYYLELESQRQLVKNELLESLVQSAKSDLIIDGWQRSVTYKYSLHPLATIGSVTFDGGRFNAGVSINHKVESLHALYLAQDKYTCLMEQLGQESDENSQETDPLDIALLNPKSISAVSISGKLTKYIDLTDFDSLTKFVEVIKHFQVSKRLQQLSLDINKELPIIVRNKEDLFKSLLDKNWRINPALFDVPANPQIFGQLVFEAGIQVILYPSKFNDKPCLAIFVENFKGTDSLVRLDDESPLKEVPREINGDNFMISKIPYETIISNRNEESLH